MSWQWVLIGSSSVSRLRLMLIKSNPLSLRRGTMLAGSHVLMTLNSTWPRDAPYTPSLFEGPNAGTNGHMHE